MRSSAYKNGRGGPNLPARLSIETVGVGKQVHQLYLALNPDARVDDLYRSLLSETLTTLRDEAIKQGIDPATIEPHWRSLEGIALRKQAGTPNAAAKPMPKGKIRPKRSPIRE